LIFGTVALGVAVAAGIGYGCTKLLFDWKPFGEGKNKKSVKDVCCEGVEKAWNWIF